MVDVGGGTTKKLVPHVLRVVPLNDAISKVIDDDHFKAFPFV